MNLLKVEYLTTIDGTDSFCGDVRSFGHLLQADSRIELQGNSIRFGGHEFVTELRPGVTENKEHRFFHVVVSCDDISKKDAFEGLLKSIRTMLYKLANHEPQVLWDDLGRYYATQAYPILHEVENLMRKLITKFMLIKVGVAWTKEAIPKEVEESIRTKSSDRGTYLHQIDFIQLSHLLFNKYTTKDGNQILGQVEACTDIGQLKLDQLKRLIPRSNWDRYFCSIVKCDSDFIRVRWDQLYERRNQVAHNRAVSRSDFDAIVKLVQEVRPVIQQAIDGVDEITLSELDKQTVVESVAINSDELTAVYVKLWSYLQDLLQELVLAAGSRTSKDQLSSKASNVYALLNLLQADGIIDARMKNDIKDLYRIRNAMLKNGFVEFDEQAIRPAMQRMNSIVRFVEKQIEMKGELTINFFEGIELDNKASE